MKTFLNSVLSEVTCIFFQSKLQAQQESNKSENEEIHRVKKIRHFEEVTLDELQTRKGILMNSAT